MPSYFKRARIFIQSCAARASKYPALGQSWGLSPLCPCQPSWKTEAQARADPERSAVPQLLAAGQSKPLLNASRNRAKHRSSPLAAAQCAGELTERLEQEPGMMSQG